MDMVLWKNIFRRMRSIRQQWRSRELWGRSVWSSWFGQTAVLPKSRRYRVSIRCWMPRPCDWSLLCLLGIPPSSMAEKKRSITRFISFFPGNVAKKVGTPYYDVPTIILATAPYLPMQNFPKMVFSTSLSVMVPVSRPSLSRALRTSIATRSVGTPPVSPSSMRSMSSAIFTIRS